MSNIPEQLKYSSNHLWIEAQHDGILKVGITDHAQQEMGDIVYVEFPEIEHGYSIDEECAVIESVKTNSDIYCPVDGEVIDINRELEENPEIINNDPYTDGWIFLLKPESASSFDDLLDADSYLELISEE